MYERRRGTFELLQIGYYSAIVMLILTNYCTILKLNWCDWAYIPILLFCDAQKKEKNQSFFSGQKESFYAWKFMTLFAMGQLFFRWILFSKCALLPAWHFIWHVLNNGPSSYFWKNAHLTVLIFYERICKTRYEFRHIT